MRLKALAIAGFGSLLATALANASESTPEYSLQDNQSTTVQDGVNLDEEDEPKILDEVIVDHTTFSRKKLPNTGRVNIQAIPVKVNPRSFFHNSIQMIIRPVVKSADGTYVADTVKGRNFVRLSVSLNPKGRIPGSRLRRPDKGERAMDLPEAIYAITEVRYLVTIPLGGALNRVDLPPLDFRFCLAERTIAFDVKNGETTDLGKLVLRGLERHFDKGDKEHRPLLGADAPFVDVSDPNFRNKAPEAAAAGIISFDPEGELCRDSSRQVPGWFTPTELKDALPKLYSKASFPLD